MRQALADLELRNQANALLTDSTLALRLADYFDRHGTPNERLHAHYLLARTWTDLGQSPRALDEFHRAAELADTASMDSIGYHYLSRVYGQMGDLLYNQQLPRNALDAYEKAYHYAQLSKEQLAAAAFYAQESACYYDLCLIDSAIYSNKRAFLLYQEVGDTLAANVCLGALAYEYMKKGRFDNAKSYLLKFQNHSYLNEETLQAYDSWKLLYYYWGYYYLKTEVPDSALSYFYREAECSKNPNNRLFAYQGLYQTYDFLCKSDSAKKYALLYAEMTDSTNKQATSTALMNIHHLYDYNRFLSIANHKTVVASRANTRALILTIAIILVLFGTAILIMRMKNRNKIIRQRLEANYANEILMYSNAKAKLQQMEEIGKEKWTAAMEEVERLKESLSQMQSDHQPPDQWKTAEELLNSIIVSQFHQAASQGKMMSDTAWHQLRTMCNNMMPEFMEAIHSFDYEPNLVDTQICILIKLRFIPSEISNLLSLSPNALSKRRRRLLKNMFGMDGSSTDFDNQIHMLGE